MQTLNHCGSAAWASASDRTPNELGDRNPQLRGRSLRGRVLSLIEADLSPDHTITAPLYDHSPPATTTALGPRRKPRKYKSRRQRSELSADWIFQLHLWSNHARLTKRNPTILALARTRAKGFPDCQPIRNTADPPQPDRHQVRSRPPRPARSDSAPLHRVPKVPL